MCIRDRLKEQQRRGRIGIWPFYRRRILRLLPALYVVVLANALFAYFSHQWLHTEVPSILSVQMCIRDRSGTGCRRVLATGHGGGRAQE